MSNIDFQDRRVMVTGATAGVGYSIAEQLLRHGARVVITGRSRERGLKAVETLGALGECHFVAADAAKSESASAGVAQGVGLLGGLDVLVSAGAEGAVPPTPFAEMTPEQLEQSFSSRVFGRIFPVHAAIPHLREAKDASIVMITTDAGRQATPGEAIIGATGASIILLTKALARELSRWQIRVNAVALTLTSDTPSWDRIFSNPTFENRLFSKALSRFPAGRAPTSTEVSHTAVFLASDLASQITGQTISVNGGLSFGGW